MDEARQNTLINLLTEALKHLRISATGGTAFAHPDLTLDQYQHMLISRDHVESPLFRYKVKIENESLEAEIVDFLRKEPLLLPYLNNDRAVSYIALIMGGITFLELRRHFLMPLIDFAILHGVPYSVQMFARTLAQNFVLFQEEYMLNIKFNENITISKGIFISRNSNFSAKNLGMDLWGQPGVKSYFDANKSSIRISKIIQPRFVPYNEDYESNRKIYNARIQNEEFSAFDPHEFCLHLSLLARKNIRVTHAWKHLDRREIIRDSTRASRSFADLVISNTDRTVPSAVVNDAAAKYLKFLNLNDDVRNKLRTPIRYLAKCQSGGWDDNLINLGTAMDALYLPSNTRRAISFQIALHAAWYLGKSVEDRARIISLFKRCYNDRSTAVHGGQVLPPGYHERESSPFEECFKMCLDTVFRIMDNNEFPNWERIVLGA